ncbi:MAG: hypothetical protein AAGF11_12285 [Myxococcota bacterium]
MKWTLVELRRIWHLAIKGGTEVDASVRRQMRTIEDVLKLPLLQSIEAEKLTTETRRSMKSEGRPWTWVVAVAEVLRALDAQALEELCQEIIVPDPELRWRLFHLGVLGALLLAIIERGGRVTSTRPIVNSSSGPVYMVELYGSSWDLWFEAGGLWKTYNVPSPYPRAMAGLGARLRVRSPDLLLVRPKDRALILECKYSSDSGYVSKAYEQVTAYANELRTEVVERVVGLTVAPEGVVGRGSGVETKTGRIGIIAATDLGAALDALERTS